MSVESIDSAAEFPPFVVPADWHAAASPRATVLLLPALGTGAGYYRPFAESLASRGFHAFLPELPGTGASRPRPSRRIDFGYRDLAERYLPGLVAAARRRAAGLPLVLAGHSLGAQVGALALLHGHAEPQAVVTIAAGVIHYRNWDGAAALKVLGAAALVSAAARLFGYLPGGPVGFGTPQPKTLMREWSRTIRKGVYPPVAGARRGPGATPALCLRFEGDFMAPPRSVAALASLLGGDLESVPRDWPGNPHASWARHPAATVRRIDDWLVARSVVPSA